MHWIHKEFVKAIHCEFKVNKIIFLDCYIFSLLKYAHESRLNE